MSNKEVTKLGENDWGFSFFDEKELSVVREMEKMVIETKNEAESKTMKLYNMIMPLLKNLSQNPEKEYIYFPDRGTKVKKFIEEIESLVKGE